MGAIVPLPCIFLATVRHSETREAMTLYSALYGERGLWVRPAAMFIETVAIDGVQQPRFVRCPAPEQQAFQSEGL